MNTIPTKANIVDAAERIQPFIHHTPVLTCQTLDSMSGSQLYFKCENLQKVGAFKMRGASNAVLLLSEQYKIKGVVTHSSGNHAQALALATKISGVKAYIVMPKNAPEVKINAVIGYGAEVIFCEPNLVDRETTVEKVIAKTGATLIHPYNNYNIIAGQATAAKELLIEIPDLDYIVTPVGGGGLLSGTALSAHYFGKNCKVIAGEPEGANDAYLSFYAKKLIPQKQPNTIADGLLTSLGDKTFNIIINYVSSITTVSEEEIISAMRLIWERMKIIVEPSSAVALAAVLKKKNIYKNNKIGIILSGGNVNLQNLPF